VLPCCQYFWSYRKVAKIDADVVFANDDPFGNVFDYLAFFLEL